MSIEPREFQIPVILDVAAYTIEDACAAANDVLAKGELVGRTYDTNGMGIAQVVSAWMVEQVGKDFGDGNDNEHGVVIFQHDLDYLYQLLAREDSNVLMDPERHNRLLRYLVADGRCGSDTIGDEVEDTPAVDVTASLVDLAIVVRGFAREHGGPTSGTSKHTHAQVEQAYARTLAPSELTQ